MSLLALPTAVKIGIFVGLLAIGTGIYVYHTIAVNRARSQGIELGTARERSRAEKALEEEIARSEKNREKILKMPDDERTRLYQCIRARVRGEAATADCERVLRDIRAR